MHAFFYEHLILIMFYYLCVPVLKLLLDQRWYEDHSTKSYLQNCSAPGTYLLTKMEGTSIHTGPMIKYMAANPSKQVKVRLYTNPCK